MALRLLLCLLLSTGAASDVAAQAEGRNPSAKAFMEAVHAQRTARQRGIVEEFFAGRRDGVFVDVGSAHYRDLSTTYFLEEEYGWSGLAIDALEHWRAGYEEHRPRTRFFTYIVTDRAGTEEPFYRLKGDIGSTAVADRKADLASKGAKFTEVLVPTITLDRLLGESGIDKIDFLSMDIEGGEVRALAGFDIGRFRPELVGIEVFPEAEETILAWFEQHGYRRIEQYAERHRGDWYFTCRLRERCAPPDGEQ